MKIVHKEHEETQRVSSFVILRVLCGRVFGGGKMSIAHTKGTRPIDKIEATIELFNQVRAQTMRIVAPLEIEDYVVQTAEFMSPPRWHIGHTSWFFETLLQTCLPGYRTYNKEYLFYFNSYYEGFGQRIEKSLRGTRCPQTVEETVL